MTTTYPAFKQTAWSLKDLYSGDAAQLEASFTDLEAKVTAFEGYRALLADTMALPKFLEIIRALEVIYEAFNRLGGYASLQFSADTQNQAAQSLAARVDQFGAEMENKLLYFGLWWKALADEPAARLMEGAGDYRYWLEEMRHFKTHTLSEPEEKVINIKNVTGVSATTMLYEAITNRYVFKVTVDGEEREMTRGELMVYARHHDAGLREAAYKELYRVYGQDGPILGQMYQTLVRDWRNEQINMRGFTSPISARNLVNDLPDEVVDTLLDVAQKNAPVFQRYFRLKAKWLGMQRLRRYDVYAPVVKSDKTYAYDDAARMVFDSFREFDPAFEQLAMRVFKENHVDSEIRKGKRGGAFCATITPKLTPWVLLNYQGRVDDVSTMAHELGHGIHSMMAEHHSIFTQHACLPLAETASTFGEMMLVDRLLAEEQDESVRRDILFGQVDGAYATIMRQSFFAMFERQAHEMIQQNASVDELAAAYAENLKLQFGDSVEVSDEFKWEWVSIPHIYNVPFYVYAYAFGQLLVLALYKQYKAEGESFKPRYKQLLAAGGSKAPMSVLDDAGVDVRKASFWQGGFDVVADLVSKLEALPVVRQ